MYALSPRMACKYAHLVFWLITSLHCNIPLIQSSLVLSDWMIWEFINLWERNWNKMMNQVCLSKNFNFEHVFGTLISITWSHRALKSSMFVGFYFSLKQINMIYFIATFKFFFDSFPHVASSHRKSTLDKLSCWKSTVIYLKLVFWYWAQVGDFDNSIPLYCSNPIGKAPKINRLMDESFAE